MNNANSFKRRLAQTACVLGVGIAVAVVSTVACNMQAQRPGGDGGQPPPHPICNIQNLPGNLQVGVGSEIPLTIIYTVNPESTNVQAYYFPVADGQSTVPTGQEVIVAEDLPPGENKAFNLPLAQLTEGFYRVAVRHVYAGNTYPCVSPGTIQVTGLPQPEFVRPASNVTVEIGDDVPIEFDMHDPAGVLNWRLFFVSTNGPINVPPDELGTQIRTGQGNSDVVLWNTSTVLEGSYYVGLSWTDSGFSVAETVAKGDEESVQTVLNGFIITVQPPQPPASETSPLIEVTQPSSTVMAEFGEDQTVDIQFQGTVREPHPVSPGISVFLDLDNKAGTNNETPLESGLPPTATRPSQPVNTKTLAKGTYFVGATINDGVNPAVTDYAPGRIVVAEHIPALDVTDPDIDLPVKPGTQVKVKWTLANVAAGEGKVDVFRRAVGADGLPTGPEIVILAPSDLSVKQATFTAAESGRFQITVRVNITDATKPDLTDVAPSLVQVTTLPLILWLGDLAQFDSSVASKPKGAVFEGHQFEDNAGSAFVGGEDFNDDGIDDFLIAAQYGKPEFVNPDGTGDGEAYLLRGTTSSKRYRGSYNLNTVSSPSLPGVVFSGIPTIYPGSPYYPTYGLVSMFISRDADRDGVGELLFGFPLTDNPSTTVIGIDAARMFRNGGVVIVSSKNADVSTVIPEDDPTGGEGESTGSDTAGTRIALKQVGMNFQEVDVYPEPCTEGTPGVVIDNPTWMRDYWTYFEGECPQFQTCPDSGDTAGICPQGSISILTGDVACFPFQGNDFECLQVPFASISGCLRHGDPLLEGDEDGLLDTLVEPFFGFERLNWLTKKPEYLARPLWKYYYSVPSLTADNRCPTCHPNNPINSNGCVCSQFETAYPWEVLDPVPPHCETFTLPLDPTNPPITNPPNPGQDPLALWPPEPPCEEQHLAIANALRVGQPWLESIITVESGFGYPYLLSGFISDRIFRAGCECCEDSANDVEWNDPYPPFGCRIIGRPATAVTSWQALDPSHPPDHDRLSAFGSFITQSGNELIISAHERDAVTREWTFPLEGDISRIVPDLGVDWIEDAGVAYLFTNIDLWGDMQVDDEDWAAHVARVFQETGEVCDDKTSYKSVYCLKIPPKPHIYAAGGYGHTGWRLKNELTQGPFLYPFIDDSGEYLGWVEGGLPPAWFEDPLIIESLFARRDLRLDRPGQGTEHKRGGVAIAGRELENIHHIVGIPDYNGDKRPDFAIGAPEADGGAGAVYVVYRRTSSLEGDYILEKLALDPNDPLRLSGAYIRGKAGEGFGVCLAGGLDTTSTAPPTFDFDHDGLNDLVIGNPNGNGGKGEIVILFSSTPTNPLITPAEGRDVAWLVANEHAALIRGITVGSQFGFNVANAGDIDDDGVDDLLIAAPNATPMFDPTPNDSVDQLTTPGLDRNLDGVADDVSGPKGYPDGIVGPDDQLQGAGLVYVVFSSSDATAWTNNTIDIDKLGTAALPGFMIAGRHAGDRLGGGNAADASIGGNALKIGFYGDDWHARSRGLAPIGDVDGDGKADFMIGSILADPRIDPKTGVGTVNGGEAYLIYGFDQE